MGVPLRAIILDFDGVLVDSNAIKDEAFATMFGRYPEHADSLLKFHQLNPGLSRVHKFRRLVDRLSPGQPDPELEQRLLKEFSSLVAERVATCAAIPGSQEFLEKAAGRVPLYLASATPQPELWGIVQKRGLASYFQEIFGDPPTPKIEAVRAITELENCRPQELLLVGDSSADWRVAIETGIQFIGYQGPLELPPDCKKYDSWPAIARDIERRIAGSPLPRV
ncbi:MAG: HAD family hydrolase [Verrucomicrobiae bacterium]|nr:HAD family hydrolase [Verrucomicrobiae bacterium]